VLALLALSSPWNYETAAMAQVAGFSKLSHGQITDGIAQLQGVARMEDGQPTYQENLATVYEGIASANPQSSESSYVPRGDDARTIDPQRVLLLGRDQLLELALLSLKSAESLTPLDPSVHGVLGDFYLNWKRPEQALAEYRTAESLSHDNPRFVDDEALVRLQENRLQDAYNFAVAGVHLDGRFWYSWYALAKVNHQMHHQQQARATARLSLVLANIANPAPSPVQHHELVTLEHSG
jgi:tetratricopeptide (TPR) repeat protein